MLRWQNFVILLICLSDFTHGRISPHPLSDQFIELINKEAKTWKAGRNFHEDTSLKHIRGLMGVLPSTQEMRPATLKYEIPENFKFPENFDARDKWSNCPSLQEVRDQGSCGSCWAISSVAVMTDRACIHSNGEENFHYSTEDLMTCCSSCGFGCEGGWPYMAFRYWNKFGIVSGGPYDSSEGCSPYQIPPCAHHVDSDRPNCPDALADTPSCSNVCQKNYDISYKEDLHAGESYYSLNDEESIMRELIENGPVVAAFIVYEDFVQYESGVYSHTMGAKSGGHAIKILGYGVEEGVKYWLCANSWNTDWGDNGYFKILRGENECGIEDSIVAGIPN